jgi:undecaprenyl diphosphate synthase
VLWPEFSPAHLQTAFEFFAQRERRFGKTSAQVAAKADA